MKENFKGLKKKESYYRKPKERAWKVYDEIIEEARAEANLIIERAKVEEREKEKAEYSLKKEAIDLALELSKK